MLFRQQNRLFEEQNSLFQSQSKALAEQFADESKERVAAAARRIQLVDTIYKWALQESGWKRRSVVTAALAGFGRRAG